MSRRRRPEKREILPDPKFKDQILSKFMNNLMMDGKKSVAEGIVYGAMETMQTRAKSDPIGLFHDALNNVKPQIEVRSRRVGGATYQVPVEVRPERAQALAIRWLITAALGNDNVGAALGRAARCRQQPRQCGQEARRHPPHGRRQPRVQPLPLVRRASSPKPAGVEVLSLSKDRDTSRGIPRLRPG
jgi:ribosomal protein S7